MKGSRLRRRNPSRSRKYLSRKLRESKEIDGLWKSFGHTACLRCGNEEDFKERYFIISRCPEGREEEEWLERTMREQYGVEDFGVSAGVFGDERALIDSAICRKCGSQNVFFDF